MITPQPFCHPDPAVIVASSNSDLRKQIVQDFMVSRITAAEAMGGADALGKLENSECQLLLLDRRLPDLNAEELLQIIDRRFPGIDVLLLDDSGNPMIPSQWRSSSALRVFETINRWQAPRPAPAVGRTVSGAVGPLPGMVGQAACMTGVYRMARLVAPRSTPVLITGPTGTGKEVVATGIHRLSARATKPFIIINCAAIPEALLESELFGYVRGAFTGAVGASVGKIALASGGTLLLDEIGEMPFPLQPKLLRVLQERGFYRLGDTRPVRIDVRVVASTNRMLRALVEEGRFRDDLYYRFECHTIDPSAPA